MKTVYPLTDYELENMIWYPCDSTQKWLICPSTGWLFVTHKDLSKEMTLNH